MANVDAEQIPSYFIQDTITLVDDRLFATFGSKFDHNTVTNFEYQPSAKLALDSERDERRYGGPSPARVRTPSLSERSHGNPEIRRRTVL